MILEVGIIGLWIFRVEGSEFRVWGLAFGSWGSGFGVWGFGVLGFGGIFPLSLLRVFMGFHFRRAFMRCSRLNRKQKECARKGASLH